MAQATDKRNLKISAGLHRRLKIFAVLSGRRMEEIAEQVLEVGLTQMLAASDDASKAAAAVQAVIGQEAQNVKLAPTKHPPKATTKRSPKAKRPLRK